MSQETPALAASAGGAVEPSNDRPSDRLTCVELQSGARMSGGTADHGHGRPA